MGLPKLPSSTDVVDKQYVRVSVPDNGLAGYQYDKQTNTFLAKASEILSRNLHGTSHVAEDPIPNATYDSAGMMSADDKAKLDAIAQTRVGILGFYGAGFADDGGWMQGDIIFAAGNEFISIERVGNVIRFTVDNPSTFSCACEACAQIYWIQDESESTSIRPPSCGGKLPGINGYGELKFYLMPEQSILDTSNPRKLLNTKGNYPALIFKRYDDSITGNEAEFELVLNRNTSNLSQTRVGWAMTPNATKASCVWFVGLDTDGNQLRYDLDANTEPGLLGYLLYNGHLISKASAVITDYSPQILTTNQYMCKLWDINTAVASGDEFVATNVWKYDNATTSNKSLINDGSSGLLELGTIVDLWFFEIAQSSTGPIRKYFFSKEPTLKSDVVWAHVDSIEFGDIGTSKNEISPTDATNNDINAYKSITLDRVIEKSRWGMTGNSGNLILFDEVATEGPSQLSIINTQHRMVIDENLPGLTISNVEFTNAYSERPVYLWSRKSVADSYTTAYIGRPDVTDFPPYDVLIRAPIDSYEGGYFRVLGTGTFIDNDDTWILIKGYGLNDVPNFGTVRMLNGTEINNVWNYDNKLFFPNVDDDAIALVSSDPFAGSVGDVVEILHDEYSAPCVRLQFNYVDGEWRLQFKVGMLDMSKTYEENNESDDIDDYVRGMGDGYTVSSVYTQSDTYSGVGDLPEVNFNNFIIYDGGKVSASNSLEYWNKLEILHRGDALWLWWNDLLIPPNGTLSGQLDYPVAVSTPYFPLVTSSSFGKVGMRLWSGATVRRLIVRENVSKFHEYGKGQLELS